MVRDDEVTSKPRCRALRRQPAGAADDVQLRTRLRYPQPSSGGDAMNWDAIGAIGQTLSALALVVVFVQLHGAREEARRSARDARLLNARETFLAAATNQHLSSILNRLSVASGTPPRPFDEYAVGLGLSEADARQVWAFYSALWRNFE